VRQDHEDAPPFWDENASTAEHARPARKGERRPRPLSAAAPSAILNYLPAWFHTNIGLSVVPGGINGEGPVIHVSKLTKYYGDYPAIRDVSFDVPRGQVVGFLGPNGAGKTTTMRILAGFMTATSGRASIDGLDVFWRPVEVRRRIGYMPENCPLYPEMRVVEYLRFRAGIKGLHGGAARRRIDYVLGRCWLTGVSRQLIGTLSKGYRQRVGLADALLADPPVLILDEPTAGLDPSQIRETRKLIRELGEQHTMLLSTHILPEVEMTCDRVIIINRGEVAAEGMLDDLRARHRNLEDLFVSIVESEEPARVG
jgi:ABC-2 type transport system ATP-binding protein